jgi:hypothetical protein
MRPEALDRLDAAIERDPRHHLRVCEVPLRAAGLEDIKPVERDLVDAPLAGDAVQDLQLRHVACDRPEQPLSPCDRRSDVRLRAASAAAS